MESTAARLPRPSASGIERTLAALLVGLLGLYAVGTILSDLAPAVDTAGVIAVHLAVVVGGVFPFAVLGHAVYSRFRPEATGPRLLEVGTALVAVTSLAAALWLALDSAATLDTPLFATAAGAALILVGLVVRRS